MRNLLHKASNKHYYCYIITNNTITLDKPGIVDV